VHTKSLLSSFIFILSTLLATSANALPSIINPPGEKLILVDPRSNAWGAYDANGELVKSGVASTGKNWCPDMNSTCRTKPGTFRIYFKGDETCYSTRFPVPNGGAPMPYCMYFHGNQALHGSYEVGRAHLSHGCVRMHVNDAEWLSSEFAEVGTLVVVRPY